ncbi:MAG: site-2 protease family protein [Clostridia bacterium]|nr:site-2 protease family protein [Clostridia bacterium]
MNDITYTILMYVIRVPVVLLSLAFHECAHAFMSYKLGDPTAKAMGRLTLNPLKHIDPLGALMMFFIGIGYARPVPVNSRYFKKPRRDMALVAAAGPLSNLILFIVSMLVFNLLAAINLESAGGMLYYLWRGSLMFFAAAAELNIMLAIFNFIPIPPLDGSRIAFMFLPSKWYFGLMKYERFIMIGFFAVVLFMTRVLKISIISMVSLYIMDAFQSLLSNIPLFEHGFEWLIRTLYLIF